MKHTFWILSSFMLIGFTQADEKVRELSFVGKWKSFSVDGTLISEVSFNNAGKRDGIWKVWNDEGELSAIMIYDSGNRIGKWKSLEKDGPIAQTVNR